MSSSTASVSEVPVLVVGAGPSGLVAALSLLQNGIPVRIIDKSPEHQVGTRGAGLMVSCAIASKRPGNFLLTFLYDPKIAPQLGASRPSWRTS